MGSYVWLPPDAPHHMSLDIRLTTTPWGGTRIEHRYHLEDEEEREYELWRVVRARRDGEPDMRQVWNEIRVMTAIWHARESGDRDV